MGFLLFCKDFRLPENRFSSKKTDFTLNAKSVFYLIQIVELKLLYALTNQSANANIYTAVRLDTSNQSCTFFGL